MYCRQQYGCAIAGVGCKFFLLNFLLWGLNHSSNGQQVDEKINYDSLRREFKTTVEENAKQLKVEYYPDEKLPAK